MSEFAVIVLFLGVLLGYYVALPLSIGLKLKMPGGTCQTEIARCRS
jgi:hypothetical protein